MPFLMEVEPRIVPKLILEEEEEEELAVEDSSSLVGYSISTYLYKGISGLLLPRCCKGDEEEDKSSSNLKEDLYHYQIRFFSFTTVSAATNNFSPSNKLGQGGFGPVYKGKLVNGEQVAIKRLSKSSQQGSEELKNEVVLISKLQHRNVVRLLGCCIEGEHNMLVYEYMPNKSLDRFLFDSANHGVIDWITRVRIIQGIAQGLVYLHHYSTLTIIHRDLKPSNILLDKFMNPKISDFGLARIVAGDHERGKTHSMRGTLIVADDQEQGTTNRIVGTYGYMAPEYGFHGIFSIKSDVFSFGILLFDILSGKRILPDYNLSDYAFELWTRGKTLELKDPNLEETCSGNVDSVTFTRYVHIALLCVQENPSERPTMSEVVMMLGNQQYCLLPPNPPADSFNRSNIILRSSVGQSSTCDPHNWSLNFVTISEMEAR